MRWWPRTIRWQMLLGLVLLELLSIALFALILIRLQKQDAYERAAHRLSHQAASIALQATEAFEHQRPEWLGLSVKMMGESPSVVSAKVTDPAGKILAASTDVANDAALEQAERDQIAQIHDQEPHVFSFGADRLEGIKPIYAGGVLRGFGLVESDRGWDNEQLDTSLRATVIFGIIWVFASILLAYSVSSSISRPLAILHNGTRALMNSPDGSGNFPLPVVAGNEFGELIVAFNRMVASIEEQRLGLNDTLSLLDSMLANAPVGLAFFDRRCRIVRVNRVFADLTGIPLSRHLGRTLPELLPEEIAEGMEQALSTVFTAEVPVHDLEIHGVGSNGKRQWTWVLSAYPVRTTPSQVRWAGVIVQDATQRKRNEEALRKTEKLAATGRLAASIAHEINNPLEAITNLLYLLRNFSGLTEPALTYVAMADHEARRIADIAQQTLRFYRQSTLPLRASMDELLDSVLNLYQGRLVTLNIAVERDYDPTLDLFCFAGEIRQVIANLVGNAVDATSTGGRLVVRAHRSRLWRAPDIAGVRFTVADTGSGMGPGVRERIFEAFFTTKEITGTGLGLWVSHEIILKHGGLVHVRSRLATGNGKSGTVFQVFLPDDESLTNMMPPIIS